MEVLSTRVCEFVFISSEGMVRFYEMFQNLPTLGNFFKLGESALQSGTIDC